MLSYSSEESLVTSRSTLGFPALLVRSRQRLHRSPGTETLFSVPGFFTNDEQTTISTTTRPAPTLDIERGCEPGSVCGLSQESAASRETLSDPRNGAARQPTNVDVLLRMQTETSDSRTVLPAGVFMKDQGATERKPSVRRVNWRPGFLEHVRRYGDLSTSARLSGVARATIYRALQNSEDFRAAVKVALEEHFDLLRLSLLKIGMGDAERGVPPDKDALKFLLSRDRHNRRFTETDLPGNHGGSGPTPMEDEHVMVIDVTPELAEEINEALTLARSPERLCARCRTAEVE